MWLDERNEFLDATALNTGGAATYLIGDVIDLEITNLDLGLAADIWFVLSVQTTATSGGSATGVFILASDAQAAIATDGTATPHITTAAIAVATLVAGYIITARKVPSGDYERYLGVLQTTAVAAFTAGKLDGFLTPNWSRVAKYYADASN